MINFSRYQERDLAIANADFGKLQEIWSQLMEECCGDPLQVDGDGKPVFPSVELPVCTIYCWVRKQIAACALRMAELAGGAQCGGSVALTDSLQKSVATIGCPCEGFPIQLTKDMVSGFAADIGGSTRPHHGFINGTEFVLKCGSFSSASSDAHVHNEYIADCLLRTAGCRVPESREYRADIGRGKVETLRLSRFIKGQALGVALKSADQEGWSKIREEVARTYPVLSFISAIDSYQHPGHEANVLVDDEYNLWFIDNGASFEFSAKGGTSAKPWFWNRTDVLGENGFFALRDAKGPHGYYQPELRELLKGVTDEQLRIEAARYDFVKLAKSLPVDFVRGKLLTYAENLNAWARGSSATAKRTIGKTGGKGVSDRIKIVMGSIECAVADAIVNAANSVHIGGSGIDGAIHHAAGPRLAKACSDFARNERGEWCPTGEARTTPAFGIASAKYIIHTAGPDCRSGYSEEWDGSALASCYRSVLNEAVKHGCKTVAIPSISTGIFGFPLEDAARIATATVVEFLKKNTGIEVTFVMWNGEGKGDVACGLYGKALAEYTTLSFSEK